MDKLIYIPPPDYDARKELFIMNITNRPHKKKIDFDKLAKLTEFYVSSDIELISNNAARLAVNEDKPISEKMILEAINRYTPILEY